MCRSRVSGEGLVPCMCKSLIPVTMCYLSVAWGGILPPGDQSCLRMAWFQLQSCTYLCFDSRDASGVCHLSPSPLPALSGAVSSYLCLCLVLGLPLLFVSAAMPPSPHHPLRRFPAKSDLHVTMERQRGCPPPLAHHHHHRDCFSSPPPLPAPLPPSHPSWPLEAAARERPPRGACTSQKAIVTVPYYALPQWCCLLKRVHCMRRDRTSLQGRKNWLHDFFYFLCFDPEGREGREEGYQSPANPPNTTLKLRTKPSDLSGQPQRTSFCNINSCTAFVPETSTSTFLVKVVSGSLGNYWC